MRAIERINNIMEVIPIIFPWLSDRLDYPVRPQLLGGWVDSFTDLIPGISPSSGKKAIELTKWVNTRSSRWEDRVEYIQGYRFRSKGTGREVFHAELIIKGYYYSLLSQEDENGQCHIIDLIYHGNKFQQETFTMLIEDESNMHLQPLLDKEHRTCRKTTPLQRNHSLPSFLRVK